MNRLQDEVRLLSGSAQFRFVETTDPEAPLYRYYGQVELSDDLVGIDTLDKEAKQIRLYEKVIVTKTEDVIFSLISGKASIVREIHNGYLLTQNYIILEPNTYIDKKFLVYLLNEDKDIKKQFQLSMQGSIVMKYSLAQLRSIVLPLMPSLERQKVIGELYFNQLRLTALKNRVANMELKLILENIKEANKDDGKSI